MIKKLLFAILLAAPISYQTFAQDKMKEVWEQRIDHKIPWVGLSESQKNHKYTYVSSQKEITVFDLEGKILWNKKFSDIAPKLGKVDELIPLWDAGVIFLFDRKLGKDQLAVVDIETGNKLWGSDLYQDLGGSNLIYMPELSAFALSLKTELVMLEAKTGNVKWRTPQFKGSIGKYIYDNGTLLMINYKPTLLGALFSGFKNQLVKINANNGEIIWDATYVGVVEKKYLTKTPLVRLKLDGSRIMLLMNGIQVFDYATGKALWAANWDPTANSVGLPFGATAGGVYGAVAEPLITDKFVYVIDIKSKRSQYIKKYNREDGKLIWTSDEIQDARALPQLYLKDNMLVLQIGGVCEFQYTKRVYNANTKSYSYVDVIEYLVVKPCGLQGYDEASGKFKWKTDKFKKGITNAFTEGNDIYIASAKKLYMVDMQTGNQKYEVKLSKSKVGKAQMILNYKEKVAIVGEKGIALHKKTDCSLEKPMKYKKCFIESVNGEVMAGDGVVAMRTTGGDYAVFNLGEGMYRKVNGRKDSQSMLSNDGKYLYMYETGSIRKSIITKLSTYESAK